jgi:hypothetical protein
LKSLRSTGLQSCVEVTALHPFPFFQFGVTEVRVKFVLEEANAWPMISPHANGSVLCLQPYMLVINSITKVMQILSELSTHTCYLNASIETPLNSQYCSRVSICFNAELRSAGNMHIIHKKPSSCGRFKRTDESSRRALFAARNLPLTPALHSASSLSDPCTLTVQIVVSAETHTPTFFCILPPLFRTSFKSCLLTCTQQ